MKKYLILMIALVLPFVAISGKKKEKQNMLVWGEVVTADDGQSYLTMYKNSPAEVTAQFHFVYKDKTKSVMYDLYMPDTVAELHDPVPVDKPVKEVVVDNIVYSTLDAEGKKYSTSDPDDPILAMLLVDMFDFYHDLFWFDVAHRAHYYHNRRYDNWTPSNSSRYSKSHSGPNRSKSPDVDLSKVDDDALLIGAAAVAVASAGMIVGVVKNWDVPDDRFPYFSLSPQFQVFTQTGTMREVLQMKCRLGNRGGISILGDLGYATADWIGLSQTEGEGGGSVTVTALTENYICVPRVSTITVTSSYGQSVALQVQQHNYYHGSLSVTPVTVDIENQMGATQVLTVNASDSWNVVSYPFWLNVSPVSGEFDDHNVTLTISTVNSSTSYRTGTVVISDICGRTDSQVEITVRQSYGYIEVADNSVSLGAEAGSAVNTTVSCSGSWNLAASTVPDWLSVSPASGSGVSTNVRLTALSDNTGEEPRTSVVRFRYTTNLSAELMVTQQAGTGILEVVEVSNVLYPNPVNDLLSVDMREACRYTVYDVAGRVVISGELTSMQKTISFSGLESGAYFVRLCDVKTGKITAAKVIKR